MSEARTTLLTAESLGVGPSDARATLITPEVIGVSAASDARATLITPEALGGGASEARLPWFGVEALMTTELAITWATSTSASVESLANVTSDNVSAQVTESSTEVFGNAPSSAHAEEVSIEVMCPSVKITDIYPSRGSALGYQMVVIIGYGFQQGCLVTLGNNPLQSVSVVNSARIEGFTSNHSPGLVSLTIINPDNTNDTLPDAYRYTPVMNRYRITEKLIASLYSAFLGDPSTVSAFVLEYTGDLSWRVTGYILYGNDGDLFQIDLEQHTIASLATALETITGITVSAINPTLAPLSARVLIEGSGTTGPIPAYTSLLWSLLETYGYELVTAALSIQDMLEQMSIRTASRDWVDYWGDTHFGIPRLPAETPAIDADDAARAVLDARYAARVISEVLRPKTNNKAIELAILEQFGQESTVTDTERTVYPPLKYDGTWKFDGSQKYDGERTTLQYGLFDVEIGYDLLGGDTPTEFEAAVRVFVEKFRAAGTQMNALSLQASSLNDTYTFNTRESHTFERREANRYDGSWKLDGSRTYRGYQAFAETWLS